MRVAEGLEVRVPARALEPEELLLEVGLPEGLLLLERVMLRERVAEGDTVLVLLTDGDTVLLLVTDGLTEGVPVRLGDTDLLLLTVGVTEGVTVLLRVTVGVQEGATERPVVVQPGQGQGRGAEEPAGQ